MSDLTPLRTYVTVRPERERREWNPAEAESIRRTWAANARQAEFRADC